MESTAGATMEKLTLCMDTLVTQIAHGDAAPSALESAQAELFRIERLLNFYSDDSDIGRLNRAAGSGYVALSPEAFALLTQARALAEATGGAFDPTVGPLVRAWRAARDNGSVPSGEELARAARLVDYRDIQTDAACRSAGLRRPGQAIDLGGIAKGYVADCIAATYRGAGVTSGLINAGGDIATVGNRPDGRPWRIGLQHPRKERGRWFAIIQSSGQAVATSGDYERYHEVQGVRYHHLIDARTGYPAKSGLISVTVVAERATDADAWATAVFVLGRDAGIELIRRIGSAEAVLVAENGSVYISRSLRSRARIGRIGRQVYF